MKKGFICLVFMAGCFTIGASCQQKPEIGANAEVIVRATFDSLEMVQRPVGIGDLIHNEQKLFTIKVCNQKKFDELERTIVEALQTGQRNILVRLRKGTYYFNESHLKLKGLRYPDADITIVAKDVTVVPAGPTLKDGDLISSEVSGESCFVDVKKKKVISPWSEMMYADSLIEVIDLGSKICRLKCSTLVGMNVPEGNQAYLDLTRWCRCYQYKVLKIENGYVDFYAHDLEWDNVFGTKHYNVNYDYVVGKTYPRFRLCNVSMNESVSVINKEVKINNASKSVHLGDASNFLTLDESFFRQFIIKGITFLGNKPDGDALIKLRNFRTSNLEICDCSFIGQRGEILAEVYGKNLYFHDNYVTENYQWGIDVNSSSSNTTVVNNLFENNGTGLSYARCVSCSGDNYYIANNTFKNFGYCGISVGAWYGTENRVPARGIIEYNTLYYERPYFEEAWRHTIMDGGAIYVWTQNERSIIRYNYIHDYKGMSHNRGIYLDDGAHHVAVYGNVIINTPSLHSIDSRRVESTEKSKKKTSFSEKNNVDIFIAYNIVDGTINFVGRENKNNGCIKGQNLKLRKAGVDTNVIHDYKPEEKNLMIKENDLQVEYLRYDDNGIIVSDDILEVMRKLPVYDKIVSLLNSNTTN